MDITCRCCRRVLDDNGFPADECECGHTTERPSKLVLCTVMLSGPARKAWGLESVKVTSLLFVTLTLSSPQAITNPSNSQCRCTTSRLRLGWVRRSGERSLPVPGALCARR